MTTDRKFEPASDVLADALGEYAALDDAFKDAQAELVSAREPMLARIAPLRVRLQQVTDAIVRLEAEADSELEALQAVVRARGEAAQEKQAAVERVAIAERLRAGKQPAGITAWTWKDWLVTTTRRKGALDILDAPAAIKDLGARWPQLLEGIAPRSMKRGPLGQAWTVLSKSGGLAGVRQGPAQIGVKIEREPPS